jgi:hypothetical protein
MTTVYIHVNETTYDVTAEGGGDLRQQIVVVLADGVEGDVYHNGYEVAEQPVTMENGDILEVITENQHLLARRYPDVITVSRLEDVTSVEPLPTVEMDSWDDDVV